MCVAVTPLECLQLKLDTFDLSFVLHVFSILGSIFPGSFTSIRFGVLFSCIINLAPTKWGENSKHTGFIGKQLMRRLLQLTMLTKSIAAQAKKTKTVVLILAFAFVLPEQLQLNLLLFSFPPLHSRLSLCCSLPAWWAVMAKDTWMTFTSHWLTHFSKHTHTLLVSFCPLHTDALTTVRPICQGSLTTTHTFHSTTGHYFTPSTQIRVEGGNKLQPLV